MSYVGIGTSNPNHGLEVNGQVFISNVEQGNATNLIPFEIYSDYTGKPTLTDSRQLRLRVTPSSTSDTYHADMGLDNVDGNVFFISNPVTGTTSGDRDVFNIKDDGNVYISHLDVNSLTVVDSTFTSITLNELSVTGTITASNIVGGSPLTLSSDSNVQVNTELILNNDLQVGDTITVGDGINIDPDSSTIHVGNFRIGYFNNKLNLGFPGYYTAIDAAGNMSVTGYVSKGGGTFNIPHPLPSMKDSHRLVHSFIEGPKADLIYRGESTLTNGSVSINIDQVSNMTQGTFQALTRDVQLFTTNLSSWDSVKGSVDGNIITIESENPESNASASWIVVAERNDRTFIESNLTNDEGVFIVEKQNIDN